MQQEDTAIPGFNRPAGISAAIKGIPATDGAGVSMTRVIGHAGLDHLDPFLLLDEFGTDNPQDYIAGFPDHPHRGFETVTYMIAGRMRHRDNHGHEGVIEDGGVQWMSAGRGIIHSEMPEQEQGLMKGFQLWVNLPAAEKMKEAAYQEYSRDRIPVERHDDEALIRVIAGTTAAGTTGPVQNIPVKPRYFDIELPQHARITEPLDPGANSFIYVYEGSARITAGAKTDRLDQSTLGILDKGDGVMIKGQAPVTRLLLVSGLPLNEPVVRGGPFVMNTREELMQAFIDYQSGNF